MWIGSYRIRIHLGHLASEEKNKKKDKGKNQQRERKPEEYYIKNGEALKMRLFGLCEGLGSPDANLLVWYKMNLKMGGGVENDRMHSILYFSSLNLQKFRYRFEHHLFFITFKCGFKSIW